MQTDHNLENWLSRVQRLFARKGMLYPAGLSATVLFFAILLTSHQYLPDNAPGVMALQFSPTPEKFTEILQMWGEEGLSGYRAAMWLDYLFPAAYGLFFASLISRLGHGRTGPTLVFFFPLAAGLFDWLENSIHLQLTGDAGAMMRSDLVEFSFILTISKWLLLFAAGVYILARIISRLRQGSIVDVLIK